MKFLALIITVIIGTFFLFGEHVIELVLGSEYLLAYYPALVYLIGTFIAIVTFGFHPALLAVGKASLSFYILVFCTIIYLSVLFPLVALFGLIGAALAYVLFYIFWSIIQFLIINVYVKKEFFIAQTR